MRRKIYALALLITLGIAFLLVSLRKESQTTRSDAFSNITPTPTGYIAPTPAISGDWNYDGVVNEQDEALLTH